MKPINRIYTLFASKIESEANSNSVCGVRLSKSLMRVWRLGLQSIWVVSLAKQVQKIVIFQIFDFFFVKGKI